MADEYPKMLYRKGTSERVWHYDCDTCVVNSAEEEAAAEGWHTTPAKAHGEEPMRPAEPEPDDNGFVQDGEVAALRARVAELEGTVASLTADLQAAEDLFKAETEARLAAEAERDEARAAQTSGRKAKLTVQADG